MGSLGKVCVIKNPFCSMIKYDDVADIQTDVSLKHVNRRQELPGYLLLAQWRKEW